MLLSTQWNYIPLNERRLSVMNDMTSDQDSNYQSYVKKAWVIYALLTVVFIAILVLFVARDNEERFFYTIMPAAAAYVFRPTERYLDKLILKFTGVSRPSAKE
jgi:hypothetical protein